jgi:hypothetical protein
MPERLACACEERIVVPAVLRFINTFVLAIEVPEDASTTLP